MFELALEIKEISGELDLQAQQDLLLKSLPAIHIK